MARRSARGAALLAAALPLLGAATMGHAEERAMSGADIESALTGNSVHGVWGKTEYRSYFAPNGTTTYAAKGATHEDVGRWRVKGDQYCSTWRDAESCYDLHRDGDSIIWLIPGTDSRYPSTLEQGKALAF